MLSVRSIFFTFVFLGCVIGGAVMMKPPQETLSALEYLERGRSAMGEQSYMDAVGDFTRALEQNEELHDAYYLRGLAHANLSNNTLALADYSTAITLNQENANTYFNRAMVKAKLKDYHGVIADLNIAILLKDNDYGAFRERGLAKEKLGDLEGARHDYKSALSLNPDFALAKLNLGHLAFHRGEDTLALGFFKEAFSLNDALKQAYRESTTCGIFWDDVSQQLNISRTDCSQ